MRVGSWGAGGCLSPLHVRPGANRLHPKNTDLTPTAHSDRLKVLSTFPLFLRSTGIPRICPESPRRAPLATPAPVWSREMAPGRDPRSRLGAGLLPCRPGAWKKPPILEAEDWDFVGQLNRHPHLARKDPALSSPASPSSGCGRVPDGLPRAGSRPLSKALCSVEALGFPQAASAKEGTRPARPRPAGSEASPRKGYTTFGAAASRPPRRRPRDNAGRGGGAGTKPSPTPALPTESARVTRPETSPRSHAAPPRPSSAPPRLPALRSVGAQGRG